MKPWPLLLICLLLLLSTGCKEKNPNTYVEEARKVKAARQLYNLAVQEFARGEILPAAEKLARAKDLVADITSMKEHKDLSVLKPNIYGLYATAIFSVYLNADKETLKIRDEEGNVIGVLASPEIALENINMAIRLNHDQPQYYATKGYIYLLTDDAKEALRWFNTAIARDKRNPYNYAYRAWAYYELARKETVPANRPPNLKRALQDLITAKTISVARGMRCQVLYEIWVKYYLLLGDKKSAKDVIKDMQEKGYDIAGVLALYEANYQE